MIGRSFFALVGTFFSITPALVYLVAGWVNSSEGTTVIASGMLVGFTTLQSRLFFPIGSMLQVSTEVQSSLALFDRIFEYLDLPHEIADAPDATALDVRGHVRLHDVSFRYEEPPEGVPVSPAPAAADDDPIPREWTLEDVDLEIQPGSARGARRAVRRREDHRDVPRTASLRRAGGRGRDRRARRQEDRLESLGEAIGVVTQETYLFHDTVRRNLLYGKPAATEEELVAAARAANIHDRIAELPEGYDTVVGERGYKLSGGEKQRLAIARVVLKDPRIPILDEATSSLDTTSERLVQSALVPLMKGRTTIAIAHRLSTILSADAIFVLDRGRIVERGTHVELLARGGLYARLYEQQFRGGLVEAIDEDGVVLASGEVIRTES